MHRLLRLFAATAVVVGVLSFSPEASARVDPQNPALSFHEKARGKFEELQGLDKSRKLIESGDYDEGTTHSSPLSRCASS